MGDRRRFMITIMLSVLALRGCASPSMPAAVVPKDNSPVIMRQLPVETALRGTLLIVHAPHLAEAAAAWRDYRRADGWRVICEPFIPPPGPITAPPLQRRIREVARAQGDDMLTVLLLGDADDRGIPTWYFLQKDASLREPFSEPLYATDHPYQLLDDADQRPDLALGRIPAQTNAEAMVLLDKVRRYEQRDNLGPWRRHVTYVAGEGHYGPVDALLERLFEQMVTTMVPDAYDVSVSYAKATSKYCPPPGRLTDTVLAQLGGTAMLFNYVGHGSATRFDALHWAGTRVPVLRTDDLARLEASGDGLSLALLTCCSAGWYDMPDGNQSLAEGMLFHPAGPVAVVAGSRNTHPYANTVLQKEFTQTLCSGRPETIGALDLAAMQGMLEQDQSDRELDVIAAPVALFQRWPSSLAELRETHVRLYNLLGDPSMRLTLPADDALEMERNGAMIAGRVTGMDRGRIVVTVETARTELVHPDRLIAVTGPDDPDLDAKAARNYVEANNRILLRAEGRVRDGRFELKLADSLPDRAAFIKAYAWGTTPDGEPFDAVAVEKFTAEGRGPPR